ncbi:hypothetical protein Dimus_027305 [Dionaea muscipula]
MATVAVVSTAAGGDLRWRLVAALLVGVGDSKGGRGVIGDGGSETGGGRCRRWSGQRLVQQVGISGGGWLLPSSSVSATARAAGDGDGDGGVRLAMVVPAGGVMFLVRGVIGDSGSETGGGRCRRWSGQRLVVR